VLESGVGYMYRTVDEAAQEVKKAVESKETRDSPPHVAERARVFSSEGFEGRLARLVIENT